MAVPFFSRAYIRKGIKLCKSVFHNGGRYFSCFILTYREAYKLESKIQSNAHPLCSSNISVCNNALIYYFCI